ncbi:hypothetical protein [Saccharothrix sp. HUAS TT1]|uniref:hypothetical protein n=1 Tax=unclassified Saccharothrix TaxID=2593673 RepID=UPI00345BF732
MGEARWTTSNCWRRSAHRRTHRLDRGGVVRWGGTDNGDFLLWLPVGDPEEWPTLAVERGQSSCEPMTGSSTRIVLDLLTGAARTAVFPEDFPGDAPSFSINPHA